MKLPLVLVCENNGYGEYTAYRSVTAGEIRARAEMMEVPAETIDGMSVWTVREAAARAIAHARGGNGPAFLEAITYRFVGHSRSDPGAYRPDGELDEWKARDPIVVLRAQLEEEGSSAAALDEIEREIQDELDRMRERGLAAPFPSALTGERVRMTPELTMPKLSDSMADAVIIKWLKSPGDGFRRGEALMEVETDKATVVYEAEADGTLAAILVPEGGTAAVGQPIAQLAGGRQRARSARRRRRTAHRPSRTGRTRPRSRGAPRSSSGSRSTESTAPAPAAGSRARTCSRRPPARERRLAAASGRGDAEVVELTPTQATIARRMVESATDDPRVHRLDRRRHVARRRDAARTSTRRRRSTTSS